MAPHPPEPQGTLGSDLTAGMDLGIPTQLPIADHADELVRALHAHQVVIVAGETGSGKTTQLPKIALAAGRGRAGMIGHTQPRRIAARALATRIAEECGVELGAEVGYAVRFTDRTAPGTLVKVMTDGILLAELARDRNLRRYDTIIIDEAHERSLNIDFLLGYLVGLLSRRPELKLIITSATIDVHRFSDHFGGAPIIEVSGRTYPVELRYRPTDGVASDDIDQVCDAVMECLAEGPGDVLVFLSGQREIHDVADALTGRIGPATTILPLYSRLAAAEQQRIFHPGGGRRVVLATNVAETSITVPGIRFVVDPGTARISRYSRRLKVQRLPIEAISQASANQRAGRCGRVSDGICIRLYSQEDFAGRPEFTDPEILRTNLAAVILAMANLRLGPVADFPFLDPPDTRSVRDGMALLSELGALVPNSDTSGSPRLTKLGRDLARVPLDPRLGRMVLAGAAAGCLREVVIIAAGLTIQDPRERPLAERGKADAAHATHVVPGSDLLTLLNLWEHITDTRRASSSSAFRRSLRAQYLNYLRVREWQDLVGQIRDICKSIGLPWSTAPDDPDGIHRALLAGLLSQVGLRDPARRDYLGARGARFVIFPGSALARKQPDWVMAAELVETSKLFARMVAAVKPDWIEAAAEHLVIRNYSEPHWSARQGAAMARERVTLYGIPLATDRAVHLARIDPVLARELLIRHALVQGEARLGHHRFWAANNQALERAREVEERSRRRGIVIDDQGLFDFYDARLPEQATSLAGFESWWKTARRTQPDLLTLTQADLFAAGRELDEDAFPTSWSSGPDLKLDLSYQFQPGTDADGVTVDVPLGALPALDPAQIPGAPPGHLPDLVAALLRSLPKPLRRAIIPVPNAQQQILAAPELAGGDLLGGIARATRRITGAPVQAADWDLTRVPSHLLPRYRVLDDDGRELGVGRDLAALQRELAGDLGRTIAAAAADVEVRGAKQWVFGKIDAEVVREVSSRPLTGYPALCDAGDHVDLLVLPDAAAQRVAHPRGVRRLVLLGAPGLSAGSWRAIDPRTRLLMGHYQDGGAAGLVAQCVAAAVDAVIATRGAPWDAAAYAAILAAARQDVPAQLDRVIAAAAAALDVAWELDRELDTMTSPVLAATRSDLRAQSTLLAGPGFPTRHGSAELAHVRRFLTAALWRARKAPDNPAADAQRAAQVSEVEAQLATVTPDWPVSDWQAASPSAREARRMADEFRVHVFAQHIRTSRPISAARVAKFVAAQTPATS